MILFTYITLKKIYEAFSDCALTFVYHLFSISTYLFCMFVCESPLNAVNNLDLAIQTRNTSECGSKILADSSRS